MGNMVVSRNPHIVSCQGLGSCVALMLYDTSRRIGALAHIMLPCNGRLHSPSQCADTAVAALLDGLRAKGAIRANIVAKMVGGASMFANGGSSKRGIGEQNIASIRHILKMEGIPLTARDVGGNHGRSVEFYLDSGKVAIASVGKGIREI
jgi:chemotaxis protein CheD